ncbi:hypothetical protein [Salidesulfovibrio onnuriiensis]|uniref:hypothetical protein n=1 Tax=Salidesulfovibrio onnuriiensis TaxID=2583823 RepID=UPI0011CB7D1B|nr:hypothetical protein [Salidesulfovibrio onnuriiensis]
MPTEIALEILKAYRDKQRLNPGAPRSTLFKYIVWDRFKGRMIMESELDSMATTSTSLQELAYKVIAREKPHLVRDSLAKTVDDELTRFFELNAPEERRIF